MKLTPAHLDEKVLIPDLLRDAPQVRPVLDSYGLRGCGGPLGPRESLGFFAKAHDVPIDRLLRELRAGLERPAPPPESPPPAGRLADTIYRPFFKAGIAVVLTVGATWGAYLLWRIALRGDFKLNGLLHEVNAHGHAQIFGWVGLFVMGFAYQAFPRFKHTALTWPRLALASLVLLAAGLVVRSVLEPLAVHFPELGPYAVAGSAVEVAAILLFVAIIWRTWRNSGKPLAPYDYYILCSLTWFIVQAVYETVYLAATLAAQGQDALLALVSTWQAPLRDVQIHGFAMLMILGVSQRVFHHFYGLPAPDPRRSLAALVCLNLAVVGEVVGLVLMRTVGHAWAGLWYGSVWLLAGSVVVLLRDWRIFSAAPEGDRSLKFLRAAYLWLLGSLALLLLLPVYQHLLLPWLAPESGAARLGFSHAFYGAIRHAVTVGFVSLMIMGVAAKVVPTLNGADPGRLPSLWLPFVLLNVGCAWRVTTQTLTDFTDAYWLTGVSGVLEVLALALWGTHLWRVMAGRFRSPDEDGTLGPGQPVTADCRVGDVLDRYPRLLETFLVFGFTSLANPLMRRMIAPYVTVGRACRLLNVDAGRFLQALNAERERLNAGRVALPVLAEH